MQLCYSSLSKFLKRSVIRLSSGIETKSVSGIFSGNICKNTKNVLRIGCNSLSSLVNRIRVAACIPKTL